MEDKLNIIKQRFIVENRKKKLEVNLKVLVMKKSLRGKGLGDETKKIAFY